ncbi:MAG: DUF1674 domain-containing protein [Pseudaminobacter sp.]|nr:DUF1674 domain-containing protein [Pseudaminobacter sp.]
MMVKLTPGFNHSRQETMTPNKPPTRPETPTAEPRRLTPQARRALEEAETRRRDGAEREMPREIGGRGGKEPGRYGDWEVKGLASDF